MKNLLALLLALTMLLALCACGEKPDPAVLVGTWKASYDWEGDHFDSTIEFKSDGTYVKTVNKNKSPSSSEKGTYTEEGSTVVLKASTMGKMTLAYSNGTLTNNGHSYVKVK